MKEAKQPEEVDEKGTDDNDQDALVLKVEKVPSTSEKED